MKKIIKALKFNGIQLKICFYLGIFNVCALHIRFELINIWDYLLFFSTWFIITFIINLIND